MKTSFIATVLNEEWSVKEFIHSLSLQTKLPDEIVIVDGGSTDTTFSVLKEELATFQKFHKKVAVKLLQKKGNRAVGRNHAIEHADGTIIACSDFGCILDKEWFGRIISPFQNSDVDVAAGYYKAIPKNTFEKSLVPYVLVMPDKINPESFLPATRSMAFTKSIWEKVGKFPEQFRWNEDYVFAKRLKKIGAKITFVKDAFVFWIPRRSSKEAYTMFYHFAKGDAQAHVWRSKVVLILARYFFLFLLLDLYITYHKSWMLEAVILLLILYIVWAIYKNYKYVKSIKAFLYLPLLQFISDAAVIGGTVIGVFKKD